MSRSLKLFVAAGAAALIAGITTAQEQPSPAEQAHEAREHLMHLQAYHMGILAPMAQGNVEYDSATAQEAAESLHHLTMVAGASYLWPEGSSSEDLEDSRALPAIWENMDDFQAKAAALEEASMNLASQAGTDLASLQAAIGQVGQACGSCHEDYRESDE